MLQIWIHLSRKIVWRKDYTCTGNEYYPITCTCITQYTNSLHLYRNSWSCMKRCLPSPSSAQLRQHPFRPLSAAPCYDLRTCMSPLVRRPFSATAFYHDHNCFPGSERSLSMSTKCICRLATDGTPSESRAQLIVHADLVQLHSYGVHRRRRPVRAGYRAYSASPRTSRASR